MFSFNSQAASSSATSYISVEEADNIINFFAQPSENTIWVALSATVKEKWLMRSTQIIDNSYTFLGIRTSLGSEASTGQRLEWPRIEVPRDGVYNTLHHSSYVNKTFKHYNYVYDDILVNSNEIPENIRIGTALFALDLIAENRESNTPYTEVKSIDAGDVGLVFRDTKEMLANSFAITNRTNEYIKKYGVLRNGLNQIGQVFNIRYGVR